MCIGPQLSMIFIFLVTWCSYYLHFSVYPWSGVFSNRNLWDPSLSPQCIPLMGQRPGPGLAWEAAGWRQQRDGQPMQGICSLHGRVHMYKYVFVYIHEYTYLFMNNILSYMIPYLFCVILPKLTESYGISVTCFYCCARVFLLGWHKLGTHGSWNPGL